MSKLAWRMRVDGIHDEAIAERLRKSKDSEGYYHYADIQSHRVGGLIDDAERQWRDRGVGKIRSRAANDGDIVAIKWLLARNDTGDWKGQAFAAVRERAAGGDIEAFDWLEERVAAGLLASPK